jgi:hypothetical protein
MVCRGAGAAGPWPPGSGAPHAFPSRWPEAVERTGHKRQRLEIDLDGFDGFGRRQFVDRGDREDRFAGVQRLVGERALRAVQIR